MGLDKQRTIPFIAVVFFLFFFCFVFFVFFLFVFLFFVFFSFLSLYIHYLSAFSNPILVRMREYSLRVQEALYVLNVHWLVIFLKRTCTSKILKDRPICVYRKCN